MSMLQLIINREVTTPKALFNDTQSLATAAELPVNEMYMSDIPLTEKALNIVLYIYQLKYYIENAYNI